MFLSIGSPLKRCGFALLIWALLVAGVEAQNRYATPYQPDPDALHLWHLDSAAVPTPDEGGNPFPLQGLFNGATLGQPSAPGFTTAVSTHTGVANAFGVLTLQPLLADGAADNAPGDFTWFGTNGAFTLEALIKFNNLPADAPGSALNLITMEGDSTERIFNFRIDKSAAPSLNLLALPNSGLTTGALTFGAPIPLTGPHALAINVWYHVAVAYNGNAGVANNLALYWTRLDAGAPAANLIGSNSLPANFLPLKGDFAVGNDARAALGENEVFPGLIDEVRISGAARSSSNFVFQSVALLGASGSDGNLPGNTLDADFTTRWSALGEGQWISYDLGSTQAVSGVSIAFYLGNSRTSRFDVQISLDTTNWQTVLTNASSSGSTTNLEWFPFPDASARYLRVVGHGNSASQWNSLTELVVGFAQGGDSDHDGLPDSWERFYFGGLAQSAVDDADADGRNNLSEFLNGLSPALSQTSTDQDGDGLPDAWETLYFGGTSQSPNGDFDRDSYSNLVEYQLGTNPSNPNSAPGDVDGDNLPDSWETNTFGTLTNWAYDDFDNDGFHNLGEMVAGTSPVASDAKPSWAAPRVALLRDTIVATNACLMPSGATYGRALNGGSFQADILLTFGGFQYTAWYDHVGTTQTVWLARRSIQDTAVGPWQAVSTGSLFVNGKSSWDAHNTISLGISPRDGTLHMAWDHHGNNLRYRRSALGLCTTNLAAWGPGMMNAEQNWLVAAGQTASGVTYPCFFNSPDNDLFFEYRNGGSGSGDTGLQVYNPATGNWGARWLMFTRGGTFVGLSNGGSIVTSTSRNAYDNGWDFAPDGSLHYTFTVREGNGAFNHDIFYVYSKDKGVTWLNNAQAVVANKNTSQTITVASPGIIAKPIEGNQSMINQQAQCVDGEGRVHVLMYHRRVEPGFEWQPGDSAFFSTDAAYYHYFRDPQTRAWSQRRLPVTYPVGSRPKVGFDRNANAYVVYRSGGKLIVASASRAASYADWAIAAVVDGGFNTEPLIDQPRLLQSGILSVFIQEDGPVSSSPMGTPLHVIEFVVGSPQPAAAGLSIIGGDVVVTTPATPGFTYQLQTRTNLVLGSWTDVSLPVAGYDGLLALSHPNGAGNQQRFYRVLRTP